MIESLYAAILGIVIPVVGLSVCRKLWKQTRATLRGRRNPDGGLLTISLFAQVAFLLLCCYGFRHLANSIKTEAEHFDPFDILELPSRANSSVIKSQYRSLSKKYHPDKNPGNKAAANQKFDQIAKAYKALSDPEARRNWEKYGHPDGYQPWTFDLALPSWMIPDKDSSNELLTLYGIGYLVVLLSFLYSVKLGLDMLDPVGSSKRPKLEVTEEDIQAMLNSLDDSSSTEDVMECLAACPQLCSDERRSFAANVEAIMRPIYDELLRRGAAPLCGPPGKDAAAPVKKTRGGKGKRGSGKSKKETEEVAGEFYSRGRRGEGNRRSTRCNPELAQVVTHNLIILLSALHRVDSNVGRGAATENVPVASASHRAEVPKESLKGQSSSQDDGRSDDDYVEVAAMDDDDVASDTAMREREDDLAHAEECDSSMNPHVKARDLLAQEQTLVLGLAEPLLDACLKIAASRSSPRLFATVVEAKAMLRRRLWSCHDLEALKEQEREVDIDLDAAIPRVKIESISVETWGESQVAVGDTVTATITIVREHASEYRGIRRRKPTAGFLSRGEPWWVILSSGKGDALCGVTPMLVENLNSSIAECKMKFQAPRRPCMFSLAVSVKSPVFVGVDCEGTKEAFRVYRHDELKEDNRNDDDW